MKVNGSISNLVPRAFPLPPMPSGTGRREILGSRLEHVLTSSRRDAKSPQVTPPPPVIFKLSFLLITRIEIRSQFPPELIGVFNSISKTTCSEKCYPNLVASFMPFTVGFSSIAFNIFCVTLTKCEGAI